jgi:SpoVK/Ycf46/Vps4 family AAA+-type ATPase
VILIIDEVDNYGKKSFSSSNSSRNNNEEINNLLKMFDEIERQNLNIIIIGITNYPDELEPALVRTGRFGTNRIEFSYLTEKEIGKMIEIFKEKVLGRETGSYKHEDNKDLWKDDKKNYVVKLDNVFWRDIEIIIMDKIQEAKEKSAGFSFTDFENSLDKTLLKGLKKKG